MSKPSASQARCDCGRRHERFAMETPHGVVTVVGCPECMKEGKTAEALDALVVAVFEHEAKLRSPRGPHE